ncbi:MAG TPA: hypothetical protein VIA02_02990 [Candidatus Limnocylindria bacterium]
MHLFIIAPKNEPGSLATVLEAVAQKGVNVTTGGGAAWGEASAIAFQVNDDDGARSALQEIGASFREADVAAAWLDDRPGTLADAARRLADAGVNIEGLVPIGMKDGKVGILFGVDNAEAAKTALGDLVGAAAG